jgi:hypothetical protein
MGDPVTCFLSKLGNARLMYSTGPFYWPNPYCLLANECPVLLAYEKK